MGPGPAFKEEVMQQILHKIAAVKHIGPGPRIAHGIERHGTLRSGQEMVGQAGILNRFKRSRVRLFIIG
ncbi:hypothetical protein D3C72_2374070 [compost metagenome]